MEKLEHTTIAGRPAPVDRDASQRPGVPMIPERPAAYPTVAGLTIEPQTQDREVLVGVEVGLTTGGQPTPVFGTGPAPRGLSGRVRRASYRLPEHKAGRWMLLILGDRIDVWESRVRRHPLRTAAVLAGVAALFLRPRARAR